jgi:asparagine synthase (glutamine-hydrolysing)
LPLRNKTLSRVSKLAEILAAKKDHLELNDALNKHYSNEHLQSLLNNPASHEKLFDALPSINNENDFINLALALDYKTYLPDDILVKVDRATMSVGLEGREPFLDHRIIEFVAQLPSDLKYNKGEKKYLLKKIAHKYIPKEMLDRPKSGFGIPVYDWLKNDLKEMLFFYISESQLSKHNFIKIKEALRLRDDFIAGKTGYEIHLWLIIIFQMWWNRWMEEPATQTNNF